MCDIPAIGALIASASIALIPAIVIFGVVAFNASTFWGALSNLIPMGIAAVLVGVALSAVNAAANRTPSCSIAPCKQSADNLFAALIGLGAGLAVFLGAIIVGAFGASIPYAGAIIAVALIVAGVACSISLGVIATNLTDLDACLRAPGVSQATAVTIAIYAAGIAAVLCGALALAVGVHAPDCFPGPCDPKCPRPPCI